MNYNERNEEKEALKGTEIIRQTTEQEYMMQLRTEVPKIATDYLSKKGRAKMCPHLYQDEDGELSTAAKETGERKVKKFTIFGKEIEVGYKEYKCKICKSKFVLIDEEDLGKDFEELYKLLDLVSISEYQGRLLLNPNEVYELQTSPSRAVDIALTKGYISGIKEFWGVINKSGVETFNKDENFEDLTIDSGLVTPEPEDTHAFTPGLVTDKESRRTWVPTFK